ncbi:MAG: C2H2-type zinc finger protein [Candidatus Thiodiazotropha sp.]
MFFAVQWKPYKSAYAPKGGETTAQEDEENFYCKVCEKKFNGPIPYGVHLNSKAHKEELEVYMDQQ